MSNQFKSCSLCAQVRPAAQFSKSQQRKPDTTRKCVFCVQQRQQQGAHAASFRRESYPQYSPVSQQHLGFSPQQTTQFGGPGFGAVGGGAAYGGYYEEPASPMECEIDSETIQIHRDMMALAKYSAKDPRCQVLVETAMGETGNDVSAAMTKLQLQSKQRKAAKQSLAQLLGAKPEYKPTVAAALSAASGDYLTAWSALKPALEYLANCQRAYGRQGSLLVQQAFTASRMDAVKAAYVVQHVIAQQTRAAAQPAVATVWGSSSSIATAA